jgi:hypothetical protein
MAAPDSRLKLRQKLDELEQAVRGNLAMQRAGFVPLPIVPLTPEPSPSPLNVQPPTAAPSQTSTQPPLSFLMRFARLFGVQR